MIRSKEFMSIVTARALASVFVFLGMILLATVGFCRGHDANDVDAPDDAALSAITQNSVPIPSQQHCRLADVPSSFDISVRMVVLLPAHDGIPETCRIDLIISPDNRVRVSLPTAWNGRLYRHGTWSFAGLAPESPPEFMQVRLNRALHNGFAVSFSDAGHDEGIEPDGLFGFDREKVLDYEFRAQHLATLATKDLIRWYFGRGPAFSYFQGISNGGREGLSEAKRFPDDFQGIISEVPALSEYDLIVLWSRMDMARERAPAFDIHHLELLASAELQQCDALDGIVDGVIAAPQLCKFVPRKTLTKCSSAVVSKDCFTEAQLAALETIYSDVRIGNRLVRGESAGVAQRPDLGRYLASNQDEAYLPLSYFLLPPADGVTSETRRAMESAFASSLWVNPSKPVVQYGPSLFELDFQTRMQQFEENVNPPASELEAFAERGGRLLLISGGADALVPTKLHVDFWKEAREKLGAERTQQFFRLIVVPTRFHYGGFGAWRLDALTTMVRWVEAGKAPDFILGQSDNGESAMPACAYPSWPHYHGKGDPKRADSFTCE